MAVVTRVPEPNLWNTICEEYAQDRPPYHDEVESVVTDVHDYDPSKHTPVFYGAMHSKMEAADADLMADVDPAVSHPAAVGHVFLQRPPPAPVGAPPPLPDYKQCPPRTYLENFVFPSLMPALEKMLNVAKKERCFERKRTRFNALDFLTEHLYNNNPHAEGRDPDNTFLEIDFVREHLQKFPRAPLPLSLLWTEEQATLVIQSFWRGYLVRRDPEVQELRKWQKMWREEREDVNEKVSDFWASKMPEQTISEQNDDVTAANVDNDDVTAANVDNDDATAANVDNNDVTAADVDNGDVTDVNQDSRDDVST